MPKWTLEFIDDAVNLDWERFNEKHPGFTNYNGWRRQRYDALNGRVAGYSPPAMGVDVGEGHDATVTVFVPRNDFLEVVDEFTLSSVGQSEFSETTFSTASTEDNDDWVKKYETLPSPPVTDNSLLPKTYEVKADGDIFVNYITKTIVTNLGEFGSVLFSFERHAAMRRRYADEWESSNETIPEIARDFDLHPKAFERYKTLHGWTHASDPFTDEEWQEGLAVEDAVEQTLESQRRAYHKKLQKEKWKRIIDDADRWRRFEQTVLEPLFESVQVHAPCYVPPQITLTKAEQPYDLVLCPMDFHYGKGSWADEVRTGYSREEARGLLISKTEKLLSTVQRYGKPRKIITAVGSDWYHVDGYAGTTTSGTPQDMDGTPHSILWEGTELAITYLDMLSQVAPVSVYYCGGNHDRMASWGLLYAVYAWFNQRSDVSVEINANPRQYLVSGKTLIGFTHGDGAKPKDLPLLMATESSQLWGTTKHRAWFTGHLHYELTRDTMGVLMYQIPSLAGSDRWHENNGYVGSRRSLAGYIVDHEDGVTATIYSPIA